MGLKWGLSKRVALKESAMRVALTLFELTPFNQKGERRVRWKEWMEKAGVSLKRMSEMVGYDKTTLWHAINNEKYRRRLSRRFWGKIGAAIRWKIKPLVLQMADEGVAVFRCPHCKTFFRVKVETKTEVIVEPVLWAATKGCEGMSKGMEDSKPFVWQEDRMARSKNGRKARKKDGREVG